MRIESGLFQQGPRQNFRLAFALIELLVVITIIAVLTAVLVPALRRARESSRGVACYNNLRQLGLASSLYADSHDARFPSFRKWLYSSVGDLTTGQIYPYLNSRPVYLCPTDKVELATQSGPSQARPRTGAFGNRSHFRDYSYAMNCGICHDPKISSFLEPAKTMLYMEGALSPIDYSGQVGPSTAERSLSLRHNEQGHLLLADLHIEKLAAEEYDVVSMTKRFWLPSNRSFDGVWDRMFSELR